MESHILTIGDIYALLKYGEVKCCGDVKIKLALHKGLEQNKARLDTTITNLSS